MKRIDVISGVNLNMVGKREQGIYGNVSLADIHKKCVMLGDELSLDVKVYQSNIEGEIVNYIQSLHQISNGIIINAGAYTHYSIAIRDALLSVSIQFVEIHMSNICARESFRHKSVLSDKAVGVICGLGEHSYYLGIRAIKNIA